MKHNKIAAGLAVRITEWEKLVKKSGKGAGAYRKPGSLSMSKTGYYSKSRRRG